MNSLTKQQCEWPDPARRGVPLHPEKHGWHIVQEGDLDPEFAFWRAKPWLEHAFGCWETKGTEDEFEPHEISNWRYLGPALTFDKAAALQARAVKWAGIVGTLMAERDQLIGVLQIAIERSGDLEPRPAWVDGACGLLNRGFLKVDRAALRDEPS